MSTNDVVYVNSPYHVVDNRPLDAKLIPVKTVNELNWIPRAQRYEGMCVTVLDWNGKGESAEYWLKGGTSNKNWERKTGIIDCGNF